MGEAVGHRRQDRVDGAVIEGVQEVRADDGASGGLGVGRELVDAGVRHRHDGLDDRRRDLAERLERRIAVGRVAAPDEHDDEGQLADPLLRDERGRREVHEHRDRRELFRRARGDRHEAPKDLGRWRQDQRAAEDIPDRVELELEARDDTEVAAAAADRPEEVRVLVGAGGQEPTIGGHDLDGLERVDGQAVLAHEPADAAAEREAGDADGAGVTERGRKPVGRGRERVLAGGQARLRPGRPSLDIDVEPLHVRDVEHDPAIDGAVAGDAVSATPDRERHPGLAGEDDGPRDVTGAGGLDDERRAAVVDRVVGEAGRVVLGGVGEDQLTLEFGTKGRQVVGIGQVVMARAERFQGRGSLLG